MYRELIEELGYKVSKRDMTWEEAKNEFNSRTNSNLTLEAVRSRYKRIKQSSKKIKKVNETTPAEFETHNFDGSIDICKQIWFDKDENKTPETILKKFGYDIEKWEVLSWTFGKWEVAIKDEENRICSTIRAKIRPIKEVNITLENAVNIAKEVFDKNIKPFDNYTEKAKIIIGNVNKLMFIPQIEAHLGKISSELDTGKEYNYKIVQDRVKKVFEETIELQKQQKCDKCLVVIGGDFFNSESNNETTSGTLQQNDIRYKQMFKIGLELYLQGLKSIKNCFNSIDVMLCSGNHARASEFYLYIALSCYFKKDKKINFVDNYRDTQSYVFGDVGIFLNHGDTNQKRLIASIPAEFYKEYGETKYRYLFVGHLHKLEVINSENGLTLHRVPTICENDAWHYENRFGLGNIPSHEIIVFDKNKGMLSNNFVYFEEDK